MILLNRNIHMLLIHNYTKKTEYFGANVQLLILKTGEQDPALLFLSPCSTAQISLGKVVRTTKH